MSAAERGETASSNSVEQGEAVASRAPIRSIMGGMAEAARRAREAAELRERVLGGSQQPTAQAGGERARGELRRETREQASRHRR